MAALRNIWQFNRYLTPMVTCASSEKLSLIPKQALDSNTENRGHEVKNVHSIFPTDRTLWERLPVAHP